MIALNLVTGYQSGWRYGLRGFLAFAPFWLFAAAFALFGRCSIVVDDTAIAKRLFGYTWEKIRWDELGCAKVSSVCTRRGALTVFAFENKLTTASTKQKRLWFTNEVEMFSRLTFKINRTLVKDHIPVYDERYGKVTALYQLPQIFELIHHGARSKKL